MTVIRTYSLSGEETGQIEVPEWMVEARANSQSVKDYIVALRANARQWSASTKTRGEVAHTTKKPHPQKGGGRARQGSLVAPQYRGGGRAFGPRPKFDVNTRINRKERRAAVRSLIAEKARDGRLLVLEPFELEQPKTGVFRKFLNACGCTGRVLLLGEGSYADLEIGDSPVRLSVGSLQHDVMKKSVRNIPKVSFSLVRDVDGYTVAVSSNIVLTRAAFHELEMWLQGGG